MSRAIKERLTQRVGAVPEHGFFQCFQGKGDSIFMSIFML